VPIDGLLGLPAHVVLVDLDPEPGPTRDIDVTVVEFEYRGVIEVL